MLDGTQKSIAIATALLPTAATNTHKKLATPTPLAEKSCANAHRNANAIAAATTTTQTTKSKTIFSWLKSATSRSFDSAPAECNNSNNDLGANNNKNNKNNNNNKNHKSVSVNSADSSRCNSVSGIDSAECTCDSTVEVAVAAPAPEASCAAAARAKSPDTTLREFRGVQSLRHLWNKRISAHEESRYRSFGQGKGSKLTKSIGCLVNATSTSDASPTKEQALRERHSLQTKRAQSLHDCTQLEEQQQQTHESAPTANDAHLDFLHREKDNFYKYKTAEQAAQHLARSGLGGKTRRSTAGIVASGVPSEDAHFPAVKASERGERIHWLKRQDVMAKRRERERERQRETQAAHCNHENMTTSDKRVSSCDTTATATLLSSDEAVISIRCADICAAKTSATAADNQSELSLSLASSDNDDDNDNETTTSDTLTAANSPQHASRTRGTVRDTTTSSNASTKRGSTDSSSTGSSATLGRTTPRRTSSASSRKYSFKTHARSYHTPRKMSNNKDAGGGGSGAATTAAGFSMVAKLTQQFNEIIQKDKSLLAEVKRKNGVLMSRGGHVYKVLETSELSKAATPSTGRSSTVQRNIKKFECGNGEGGALPSADAEKPKVPAKSLHVLRKRHELVSHMSHPSSKRLQLSLPLQNGHASELHVKRTQISLPPLEMVQEEAKTPLEHEERSVLAVANATASAAAERYVPNAEIAQCTYSAAPKRSDNERACAPNEVSAIAKVNYTPEAAQPARQTQSSADNGAAEGEIAFEVAVQAQLEAAATELAVPLAHPQDAERPECGAPHDAADDRPPPPLSDAVSTATVAQSVTIEAGGDVVDDAEADAASDEKLKQRKHKYAKIYEKFRFRSPFSKSPEKKATRPATTTTAANAGTPQAAVELAVTGPEPEAKLLDALEVIDQKLKGLSGDIAVAAAVAPIVLREHDDFEQLVLPNSSFVYQASAKQVCNNELIVTQAVNVALVNSIEGDQLIMEQKELQQQATSAQLLAEAINPQLVAKAEASKMGDEVEQAQSAAQREAIYEPIAAAKELKTKVLLEPQTFLYKIYAAKSQAAEVDERTQSLPTAPQSLENIYQTLEEARQASELAAAMKLALENATNAASEAANLLNDYESIAGSCEQAVPPTSPTTTQSSCFDGYEICEPPPDEPPLATQPPAIVRNTNDELPELPKPKRRLPKSPMPGRRPPKPVALVAPVVAAAIPTPTMLELLDDNDDHHYYADDENIYDTIKGSHCYESLHSECLRLQKSSSSTKGSDSVSLTSNCYESISHYRRLVINGGQITGSSSGSTLTISSDHKTNSLYEMSLAAGLLYGAGSLGFGGSTSAGGSSSGHNSSGTGVSGSDIDGRSRVYCHSIAASSDNSDAWIDISDAEADVGSGQVAKQQFIVVRERSKVHRSPDWSKRIRDKRLQQKKAMSCIEDDSDHYYESLSPLGNKRHSTQLVQRSNSHHKRNQDLPRQVSGVTRPSKKYSASAHALGAGVSDDYDSFDTDTDDIYETDEHLKNQNDSGVDIRHVKLPDPPPSTNQVYAIVRKFKNFISNKKSPNSSSKLGGSQQKVYENSSQFYVEGNVYENTPKPKSKTHKTSNKLLPAPPQRSGIYENTEFHSPPPVIEAVSKQLSTSDKNLSVHGSSAELLGTAPPLRPKSKASKSFKSRLRKSVGGSIFDSKQLSTLTPTRSTFYIEDPSHGGSGELDSGFSEKASSGDLPVAAPTLPTPESQRFSTVARKAKKEAKTANAQRRRTTIGIRPHEPPPPPPSEEAELRVKQQTNTSATTTTTTTSWYAECGVFKHGTGNFVHDEHSLSGSKSTQSQSGSMTTNGNSWYAEAGLYQTSGVSVASSSGSSGVSTGNEGGLGDDMPHNMFPNEPLYQIYSAEKLESISRDMEDHDGSTDGYEEVGQNRSAVTRRDEKAQKHSRPSALQLVGGPSRTLWSEIPEVINSCILPTLTPRERGLQEAKFEIITSEASYLKSLNLLRNHFMNDPLFRDTSLVSARDRKALFAYIVPVQECSERLLAQLESCWQDSIMLLGISRRIFAVAEKYFHVYIAFCEHQGRMDRTLRRLKEAKGMFSQNLDLLEASTSCCGLNLHSFLMLPMQRITRLPLLIDAVFSKVSPHDDEYDSWKMTLAIMNKIVTQCNEAANRCEQAYEIERISRQLEFPSSIRALAIAPVGVSAPGSKPRFLVKKGELTHLIWRGDDAKLTFGKKFTKSNIYVFLFSDLLVLTKRKAEELFQVFDYCPRSMLTITSGDALPQLPTKDINQTGKNLILMTLLENHERKTIELVLSCPSVSEQQRWLQAMRPPEPETPGEKLYEQWDCPQVIAKHEYEAKEPDVLNLELGDVVNVSRKLPDGWYQGERIRDGAIGWFPGSYTEEVNSAHVRARNLKQRHRLLTFTATYLESQKRK